MSTIVGFNKEKKKAAVFVAHPDDETIWLGGTILTYKDWEWNIFVLSDCGGRIERLQNIVKSLYQNNGVSNINITCFNFPDSQKVNVVRGQKNDVENEIKKIDLKSHDIIFTHNELGEYGHPQHKLLNEVLMELFPDRGIYHFICPAIYNQKQPFKNHKIVVPITKEILEIKERIFNEGYPAQSSLWTEFGDFMIYEFKFGFEMFTKI